MHPGATSLLNQCDNAATGGLTGVKPSAWTAYDFYCNAGMDATQLCDVYADNVFADARPRFSQSTRPGTTIRYTYPLDAHVPGVHLYHPHHHGSISSQMPTTAGPIIVPEASLPGGLAGLHTAAAAATTAECNRLQAVLSRQKVEDSTLIQFSGLWFRNNGAAPEDDSLPFLGLNGNQINPLLFDANGRPLFTNLAGRDWALANGAFQPSIPLTAQRYARWNLISAFTMRWLDLTVQQVNATGQLSIVPGCSFRLMGRDGVPLPTTPRLVQSKGLNGQTVSNLIINTGNRVDVLVKCDAPGTYLLVSGGAGPFKTNPAACKTTHCELFGDTPVTGATVLPGNNLYNGFELSGAVMAVLNVAPLPADGSLAAEPNFADGVCRSMLEKWYYTDFLNFPPGATKQCFSFMNANFGGMCAVNNQPLLVTPVEQGTSQEWEVRDTTYHPFHLHMAPVRMAKLPRCATDVTNMWAVGDWNDVVSLPVCQWGCPWTATGSGLGAPGNRVSVCDAVTLQWRAPDFSRPTPLGAPDLCNGVSASMAEPASCTASKWSMFHCHAIPHEDEGCLAVLEMTCPGSKPKTASCPNTY